VSQRSRFAAVLLIGVGLLAGITWVGAQPPPAPPAAWAPTGSPPLLPRQLDNVATPLPQPTPAGTVIASTKAKPQAVGTVPLPDDGLMPPPPRVQLPPNSVKAQPSVSPIRQASFQTEQPPDQTGAGSALSRAGSLPPAAPPIAPAPSGHQLTVEVTGPEAVAPGEPVHYQIVVRNPGSVPVSAVRVEDQVPPGAKVLHAEPQPEVRDGHVSWNLGNLEAGGERVLKVEIQTGGEGELALTPSVTFTAAQGLRVRVVRPPFAVTQSAPETARRGERFAFQIKISNNTPTPIQHVIVRDQLPAGLQHPQGNLIEADIGALGPNETRTIPLDVVAVRTGRLTNDLQAWAEGGLQARSTATVTVAEPSLTVRLDGPRRALANRDVDLSLEVVNPGTGPAGAARLIAAVPEGMDFVAAGSGGRYDPATRAVAWSFGILAGKQGQSVSLKLKARGLGDWQLQAVAVADGMAEAKAGGSIRVEGAPALALEVVYSDSQVEVGAVATYQVRVLNQGSAPSANVRLVATLPEGLMPLAGEGPTPARVQQQQVVFEPLPQMAPRADAVYRIRAKAQRPGDWRFRAEMTADPLQRPVLLEESTHVYSDAAPVAAPRADR
jgi:uncharacterized repeat protein (TIGR01451 family)